MFLHTIDLKRNQINAVQINAVPKGYEVGLCMFLGVESYLAERSVNLKKEHLYTF